MGGNRGKMRWLLSLLLACALAGTCRAGIRYDSGKNVLKVVDFPSEFPCTAAKLFRTSEMNEWGKVAYDKATDTYTVNADLVIGDSDGTDTHFQLGVREHPKETLILKGNLIVYPYWIKGENPEALGSKVKQQINRFTMGHPADKTITPTLKFDCEKRSQYGLHVCAFPDAEGKLDRRGRGGQLHVHNGVITALTQDKDHAFGSPTAWVGGLMLGDSHILDGATISWASKLVTYGMAARTSQVTDTTFSHCETAVYNGTHRMAGCTFSDCQTALQDGGCLDVILTDCTFQNNGRNWSLRHTDQGITCIDCTYDTPKAPNTYTISVHPKTKKTHHPIFASKRHVVVEVVDGQGKPVAGAEVRVACEQKLVEWEEFIVVTPKSATNATGKTPGKGEEKPILLTEIVKRATKTKNQPEVKEYSYTLEASADGFTPNSVKNYKPAESWKVVRIVLAKK